MLDLSACEEPSFLRILMFSKTLIDVIKIGVPIGLIILISIDLFKATVSGEKELNDVKPRIVRRLIGAVMVVFVPTIVSVFIGFIDSSVPVMEICLDNMNPQTIKYLEDLHAQQLKQMRINNNDSSSDNDMVSVSVVDLKKEKRGKLNTAECNYVKGRMEKLQWTSDYCDFKTLILINYSNCEFLTIKKKGCDKYHIDFYPATLEDSKMYHKWYDNNWGWNPRKGTIVYFDGKWSASAIHGCPHSYGHTSSGLTKLIDSEAKSCAAGAGFKIYSGGHFCLHLKGSVTHASGEPNTKAQNAIKEIYEDSAKYK